VPLGRNIHAPTRAVRPADRDLGLEVSTTPRTSSVVLVKGTGQDGLMRSVILFRHGKSDWQTDTAGDDRKRPLSRRGQRAARTMGRFIALAGEVPDAAITSHALRASETLRLAKEAGDWNCPELSREGLAGDVNSVLEEIRAASPVTGVLLVVGHEPTLSQLAEFLIGGGSLRLPTGALARIELDAAEWTQVGPGCGQVAWLVLPRLFPKRSFDFAQ
jgi:phosphohistidine phosphatase